MVIRQSAVLGLMLGLVACSSGGATGGQGWTGPAGPTGATGAQGATGFAGGQGSPGATGADGTVGPKGPAGTNGKDGTAGLPGAPGATGATGPAGATGLAGAAGLPGATGAAGPAGAMGPTGPVGPPGVSFARTVLVSPAGTPAQNGSALLAAMAGITTSSATNPFLLKLEPGIYDLGTTPLDLKPYVDVEGSGENVTVLTSTAVNAALNQGTLVASILPSPIEVRSLTLASTGAAASTRALALFVTGATLKLTHVTATATNLATPGSLAASTGILTGASATVTLAGSTVQASGGDPQASHATVAIETNGQSTALSIVASEVHGSGGDALFINGTGSAAHVAASLIDGNVTGAGGFGIACVGAFDRNYAGLSVTCQ